MNQRPTPDEYNEYYGLYIEQAKEDQITTALETGQQDLLNLMNTLPADKWDHKYGPDKWTIKEAILHVIDTERIFSYRALRIGRHDETPLRGFDQNDYVPHYNAAGRSPASIIAEYQATRTATLSLFQHLTDADLKAMGTASGQPTSCRSLGFMIAGHEQHHLRIIQERYLA